MSTSRTRTISLQCCVCLLALFVSTESPAAFVPVFGGPEYDSSTGNGYVTPIQPPYQLVAPANPVSDSGIAVGWATKYVAGNGRGSRVVRWNASVASATELDNLGGSDRAGNSVSQAYAVNNSGAAVGIAQKYVSGIYYGDRAVRWDGSVTTPIELELLGTNGTGFSSNFAYAINDSGTAVGLAAKYVSGTFLGTRAARWDGSGTAITELDNLGTSSGGGTQSFAYAVNNSGTAVGYADKYVSGTLIGPRAVRWDGSGTAATELGNLGTLDGGTASEAYAVNETGTAVGYAFSFDARNYGERAVRWNGGETDATELGHLGTSDAGLTESQALAVNDYGAAVGWARKYDSGVYLDQRAVRWDASGTTATELGSLGTYGGGFTWSRALAINNNDIAVGYIEAYVAESFVGYRAVAWKSDAVAIDLNSLIDPASGWTLTRANDISNTDWITGIGQFDPDGPGGQAAYDRLFLLQLPPVPEPATWSLLMLAALTTVSARPHRTNNGDTFDVAQ